MSQKLRSEILYVENDSDLNLNFRLCLELLNLVWDLLYYSEGEAYSQDKMA